MNEGIKMLLGLSTCPMAVPGFESHSALDCTVLLLAHPGKAAEDG